MTAEQGAPSIYVEVWREDPATGITNAAENALWRGYLPAIPREGETIMLTLTGPERKGTGD